jgi:DNA-binding PadR family transcriptional regulator
VSVRQSLLAILSQGPCYGNQLRAEYERRTGAGELNVGQIYTTLERLERDGFVSRGTPDDRGHVHWSITPEGRGEVDAWFAVPAGREGRDDLAHKVALAATLPGVDAAGVIAAQRVAAVERLARLEAAPLPREAHARIVDEAVRAHARADVSWLESVAATVADATDRTFGLSPQRPRRGRPVRARTP